MPLEERELISLPEHLSSPPDLNGVGVTMSLVLCVCFVHRCLSFCPYSFGYRVFWFDIFKPFTLKLYNTKLSKRDDKCSSFRSNRVDISCYLIYMYLSIFFSRLILTTFHDFFYWNLQLFRRSGIFVFLLHFIVKRHLYGLHLNMEFKKSIIWTFCSYERNTSWRKYLR